MDANENLTGDKLGDQNITNVHLPLPREECRIPSGKEFSETKGKSSDVLLNGHEGSCANNYHDSGLLNENNREITNKGKQTNDDLYGNLSQKIDVIGNDPYEDTLSDIEDNQIIIPHYKLTMPNIENKTIIMPKNDDIKVIIPHMDNKRKKLTISNSENPQLAKSDIEKENIVIPKTEDQKPIIPNAENDNKLDIQHTDNLTLQTVLNQNETIPTVSSIDNVKTDANIMENRGNDMLRPMPKTERFLETIPETESKHEEIPAISRMENEQTHANNITYQNNAMLNDMQLNIQNIPDNQSNMSNVMVQRRYSENIPNMQNIQSNYSNQRLSMPNVLVQRRYSEYIPNIAGNQPNMPSAGMLQQNMPSNYLDHRLSISNELGQRRYSENIANSQFIPSLISTKKNPSLRLEALAEATRGEDTNEVLWGFRMKEFLSTEWSVVGVSYILKRGVFWLRRLIWLLLVLFGFGFMLYQIRDRAAYYLSNPTQVNIALSYKKTLPFPTVTVCSENLLDKNRSMYQYILPNGLPALLQHIYPPMPAPNFHPNFSVIQELNGILNHHNITWEFFWESLSPFQNKRHLIHCEYNGQLCDKGNLSLVTTDMGYCLQFNGVGYDYQTSRPGLSAGLVLTVDVRQIDFVYTKSIGSGLRVLIHRKEDVPHVENYGFRASTGYVTSAPFRLQTTTRLPVPYDVENCTADPNYSYNGCVDKCRHSRVIEACGCRFFYYPGSNITTCNPQEMYQCADPEIAEYPNNHVTAKLCGCLAQCKTNHYLYSLSQSVMSDFAVTQMALEYGRTKCKNDTLCRSEFDAGAFENVVRRDWAQIQVYFSDLIHEEIVTSPAYPMLQLLCDIGGALGLILGATVLSFCEMIDFIFVVLYDWINFQIGKRRDKKRMESQTVE